MTATSPYRKWYSYNTRKCSKATNKGVSRDAERKAAVRSQRSEFLGADVQVADQTVVSCTAALDL